jgi:hypothetical protein
VESLDNATTKQTYVNVFYREDNKKSVSLYSNSPSPCSKSIQVIFPSMQTIIKDKNMLQILNILIPTHKGDKYTIYALLKESDQLWEFDMLRKNWTDHDFKKLFPILVKGVKGGVRCKDNITWFFKGFSHNYISQKYNH